MNIECGGGLNARQAPDRAVITAVSGPHREDAAGGAFAIDIDPKNDVRFPFTMARFTHIKGWRSGALTPFNVIAGGDTQ